ncbi:DeoR/GlpR family DNA-binding transcription regulator [Paludibacterium paludis]|uniref:DeoR family transcriptional regulator n=1 Tax=Paludibacterium paludis TaxID=1225769 RepID=A0A918P279_9NEIS|nr:DeoR/GlpR family DNA-binding transcription regulator [Paludibacterium paludis]GGY13967.1 DeoR family transcriptional regulator [Paludibacterium paludis]
MLTRQRRQWILSRLREEGLVVAATLSRELGVSEDTIRRDLRDLAARGCLLRVHGGALPASPATANLAGRAKVEPEGKRAIAKTAAAMVRPGQIVLLDGGTTCRELARQLPRDLVATVVTHSPTVAVELTDHEGIDVVLIGGRLFKHSMVTVGAAAVEMAGRIHADLYFMGVTGISAGAGLTTGDQEESGIKRALMGRAAETWVLASSEKLDAASPWVIAPCAEVSGVIVEHDAASACLAAIDALGVTVLRADSR